MARNVQRTFGVSRVEAEDAIGAAVETLLSRNDLAFDGFQALRAWLLKAARFRIMDLKKHKRILYAENIEDRRGEMEKISQYNPIDHLFDGRDAHRLMLGCLNIHERSVIMVHDWLELSFEEMAERRIDGLTAETLRQRYHRAMKKLKTHVEEQK